MNTIALSEREKRMEFFLNRYKQTVPAVRGGVKVVLLRENIVNDWAWLLTRASLDIQENDPEKVLDSLDDIKGLVERIGSRVALPEGFAASAWEPVPTIEFWKSHVTGLELPNPFVTGNITEQMFIRSQLGDAFADELEFAAKGGRSYQEEFDRRENERLAEKIDDLDESTFNPYIMAFEPDDLSPEAIEWRKRMAEERKRLARENPPLAEWLKKIAKPLYLNPYETGEARNMTREMQVMKADPVFATLLKRTARWKDSQLAAELMEVEEQAKRARARADQERAKRRGRQ